jgi:hypothetical protein
MSTLALNGCIIESDSPVGKKTNFVYPRQPVYHITNRQNLTNISGEAMAKLSVEEREAIIKNFNILLSQEAYLKSIIESHNKYAEKMNEESGIYGTSKSSNGMVDNSGGLGFDK